MALLMASRVQSLQTVQPLIVLWPLTVNNQPATTFPTPTLVLSTCKLPECLNKLCAGSLNKLPNLTAMDAKRKRAEMCSGGSSERRTEHIPQLTLNRPQK